MGKLWLPHCRTVAPCISTPHARSCRLPRDASLSIVGVRDCSAYSTLPAACSPARDRLDDLFPMKTAVLDEDLVRMPAANYHPRQIDPRNMSLQAGGRELRL